MAVCLINKSGGGITSDDVTASKAQVLQGYTALTADSDDEPVQGTIPNRGHRGANTDNFSEVNSFGGYVVGFAEGYYKNEDGRQPYVVVPTATVKNAVGYKPEKTLNDTVTCGERGTIPVRGYHGPDSSEMWLYPQEGGYAARIEEGYYHKGNGYKPYVIVPTSKVKQAVNYHPEKTLNDTNTCGEQGQIPIWAPSGGDVIMANNSHSGQGFAYDLPGVGRGIAVGIKNGAFIQGANYVFFPMQNLLPHNLRAGENFAGINGTMPDYSTGRVVFNGATFDNVLVSGVAAKNFYFNRELYSYQIASGYGYSGVYGGGMNLSLRTTSPELRGRKIGCILSQSNNLIPFRRIVVDYRTTGSISGNPTIDFYAFIAPSRALVREGVEFNGARVDGFSQMSVQVMASARQGQLVIDTSNINEQAFLGFYASANASGAENFSGAVQITKIEFLN